MIDKNSFEDWWNLCRRDVYKNVHSRQWGWVRKYTKAAWNHGYNPGAFPEGD